MATTPKALTIAIAGNPNCGKTTLFNHLTGARQRVGNFSGVTVTRKEGVVHHKGWKLTFVDLPGTYSLSSQTPDELVCREYIHNERPDIILNVLDAGNLERNLFLTTQLIEMDVPRVYVFNMIDEAQAKGIQIDTARFAELLDGPVVETVGRVGKGLDQLLDAIVGRCESGCVQRHIAIPLESHLRDAVEQIHAGVLEQLGAHEPNHRWLAIKLLEGDKVIIKQLSAHAKLLAQAKLLRDELESTYDEEIGILLADARYGFIFGLIRETVGEVHRHEGPRASVTDTIDALLLNRVLGLPILLGLLWLMFQGTFTLGAYPMEWIDAGVGALGDWLQATLTPGLVRDLVIEGVLGGLGGIVIFLPNILLLFLFIAFFETTGYLARAAFLVDRLMHGIGLHGKAFIPLLMGFGCNVPAIMATRTIENPRDRLVTILINPFMSCSARLPVYVLIAGIFFADMAGTVVFLMHLIGVLVSMGAALLLKRTLFQGEADAFVLELPPYRLPTLRSLMLHMWERAVQFLKKMGGIILVGSILIWFLQAFPRDVQLDTDYAAAIAQVEAQVSEPAQRDAQVAELERQRDADLQQARYLGRLGQAVQPVFEPLGFDWRATIALLTGFVAKEVVVSTFGVLYRVGGEVDEEDASLRAAMSGAMSPLVAFAFMVYTLLYMPCLATIAAIRRETLSWGWTFFSMGFSLGIAWVLAFLVIKVGGWLL